MAKGAIAKQEIMNKIMEVFPNAFLCAGGKELRIPMLEDSQEVQIKVVLTCAKENVEHDGSVAKTAGASANESSIDFAKSHEPSEQEKKNVSVLLDALGLN